MTDDNTTDDSLDTDESDTESLEKCLANADAALSLLEDYVTSREYRDARIREARHWVSCARSLVDEDADGGEPVHD